MKKDMIEAFLDKRLITNPSTRKNYRNNILNYFKLIEEDKETYFNNGHTFEKYENDLQRAFLIQEDKGKPMYSRRSYFSAIKTFMLSNDKKLKDLDFWETLTARMKGVEPESKEAVLNPQDVKKIISHGNGLSKALFLMLFSSGRRVNEILALTPDDIDTSVEPATISITKNLVGKEIRSTKTKQTTLCYITNEARDSYLEWMNDREQYLKEAKHRNYLHARDPDDPRVFPFLYDTANYYWRQMLYKMGEGERKTLKNGKKKVVTKMDSKTHRMLKHPHVLRKVFRSYLGDADFAEYLMGHATQLVRTYRQMKPEDMAAKYQKLMPNISIFNAPVDLSGINEQLETVMKENIAMKRRLETLEKMIDTEGNKALNQLKEKEKRN